MTAFLPDSIQDALQSLSLYAASESFGIVAFALVMVLLLATEALRAQTGAETGVTAMRAVTFPLLVAVGLSIVLRVVQLLP